MGLFFNKGLYMSPIQQERIAEVVRNHQTSLLSDWINEQVSSPSFRRDLLRESELREQSEKFLNLFTAAVQTGNFESISGPEWAAMRDFLVQVSRTRAKQGFSPSETAVFILSFKQPLFSRLRMEGGGTAETVAADFWIATTILDKLGLFTTETFQKTREEMIARQQQEMLELSTPVVKLWDGILALPMIGTLDSARTQIVMETLLQRIVETGSEVAIIDITGVPTVDTLVAQHLLKTVAAARLMGADCIISGIRPQIAQTMVHLAIDLNNVITKANLADAFSVALQRLGKMIGRSTGPTTSPQQQPRNPSNQNIQTPPALSQMSH
jgi:rsbT co-antagonist protein RsbR